MHWLIKCRSRPDTDALRMATIDAHRDFLDGYPEVTCDDDGVKTIGSVLILDVADKSEADAFWAEEPFNRAGVYESTIERWRFGHV